MLTFTILRIKTAIVGRIRRLLRLNRILTVAPDQAIADVILKSRAGDMVIIPPGVYTEK